MLNDRLRAGLATLATCGYDVATLELCLTELPPWKQRAAVDSLLEKEGRPKTELTVDDVMVDINNLDPVERAKVLEILRTM